jgi:hypothetical protein
MGKRKQDLGDVPMGGTKSQEDEDSDDVSPARRILPYNL